MMQLTSFGKLRKIRTSRSKDPSFEGDQSPRTGKKWERTSSDVRPPKGQNFISRLTSMGSSKSTRSKSGDASSRLQACAVQVAPSRTVIHTAEVAELEMVFNVFDANGDGQICLAELGAVLRSLSDGDVTEDELQLIMSDVDKNHDGVISLDEFKDVHCNVGDPGSPADDPIRDAFATFDKDGNNLICADELRAVLQSLGEKGHTLDDCKRMISRVDLDGDGFVNYEEFQLLLGAKS